MPQNNDTPDDLRQRRFDAAVCAIDLHIPDWWQRLNVETLDLFDLDRCVLGQMRRSFCETLNVWNIAVSDAGPFSYNERYRDRWIALVQARRAENKGR